MAMKRKQAIEDLRALQVKGKSIPPWAWAFLSLRERAYVLTGTKLATRRERRASITHSQRAILHDCFDRGLNIGQAADKTGLDVLTVGAELSYFAKKHGRVVRIVRIPTT